ncbi:MAG: D-alanyl-D-alanine carboxypeptidase [Proteobacteria bacterium]|nr:MAG: D-alanyl-D-alanine carboxypeptidase [Pseudomonadota bacterium]
MIIKHLNRFLSLLFTLSLALPALSLQAAPLPVPAPPTIKAPSYLLIDFDSGEILAEKMADQRVEPASITKLMTSFIVLRELRAGKIQLTDQATVSEKAWRMVGSRMFIEAGKQVSIEELLKGMIIQSGNDASVALAEHVAGSETAFAELMNFQAEQLGMTGTHFVNSTGLPHDEHYMTARDIATLAAALIREFPTQYAWYAEKKYSYNGISQWNRNKLLWRDPSVDGVKTGHTESAGYCLVASAKREQMRLVSVVLGTESEESRARESQALLNYGFRFFETHRLYAAGNPLAHARVWKGAVQELPLGLLDNLYITIPRGTYKALKASMDLNTNILAPAQKGQTYGTVNVTLEGETRVQRPLVALQDVAEGSLVQRLMDSVRLWFH